MTGTDWAGRGFTGPPATPDPSELRLQLRKLLAARGPLALVQVEQAVRAWTGRMMPDDRRELIAELAAMRDDGEVAFVGPRYQLTEKGLRTV